MWARSILILSSVGGGYFMAARERTGSPGCWWCALIHGQVESYAVLATRPEPLPMRNARRIIFSLIRTIFQILLVA